MHSPNLRHAGALAIAALFCLCSTNPGAAQPVDEIQALFERGLAARDADHLATARECFEEILRRNPNLNRVRLELALTEYRDLNYGEARSQARQVLDAQGVPADVRANVEAFLAQIDKEEAEVSARYGWIPSVETDVVYDTNVNVGPGSDIFFFSGTPIELGSGAENRSDAAVVVQPRITYTSRPHRRGSVGERSVYQQWQTDVSLYHRQYFDETDFNLTVLSAGTGPSWTEPGHWRANLRVQGDYLLLGGESLGLFASLLPSVAWEFPGGLGLIVDGVVTDREYTKDIDDPRDALFTSAGVGLGRQFNDHKITVQGGVRYSDLNADSDRFSYDGPELYAGASFAAWNRGTVSTRIGWRGLEFKGPEPVPFGIARDEDEWHYLLGFEHAFASLDHWVLRGTWIHTENDSNIPIYEYDRDVFSLGFSSEF